MRKLDSYVRKYGREIGEKMYRNLQREAALASVHTRLMKRLRSGALAASDEGLAARLVTPTATSCAVAIRVDAARAAASDPSACRIEAVRGHAAPAGHHRRFLLRWLRRGQ